MTAYTTAAGRTVTIGTRINAFGQQVHAFECDGCDGIRGFNSATAADSNARDHAEKCTATGETGGAR